MLLRTNHKTVAFRAFLGGMGIGFKVGNLMHLAVATIALELFRFYLVPDSMAFAYTNVWTYFMVIFVAVNVPGMATSSAGTVAFLGGVLVPFAEACLCNSGFKALGGHAIYDFSIAAATLIAAATDHWMDERVKST